MWLVLYRLNDDGTKEKWSMVGEIKDITEAQNKKEYLERTTGWKFIIKEVA